MDPFIEVRFIVGMQFQAERRAEAAATRLVTEHRHGPVRQRTVEGTSRFHRLAAAFRVNRAARA